MGLTDFLNEIDIEALTRMFQSSDYSQLKNWVFSRKYAAIAKQQLEEAKEVFESEKSNVKVACAEFIRLSRTLSSRIEEKKGLTLGELARKLEGLLAYPFIDAKLKQDLLKFLRKERVSRISETVDKMYWQPSLLEFSIVESTTSKLDDPIMLLSDLLEILNENFRLMKDYAKDWINKLMIPVRDLVSSIDMDLFKLEIDISSIRQDITLTEIEKGRQTSVIMRKLEELKKIRLAASKRFREIRNTALLAKDISTSIGKFLKLVSDQLLWLQKRASYIAALSVVGQGLYDMKSDSKDALGSIIEDMQVIRSSVGKKESELNEAIATSVGQQEILNRIITGDRGTIAAEYDVEIARPDPNEIDVDVEDLLKIINEISEL